MRNFTRAARIVVAATIAGGITVGCAAADDTSTSTTSDDGGTEIDSGLGARDASDDVKVLSFEGPDAVGFYTATVQVTNNSSKTSDYYIEANVEDSAGSVTDYTNGLVNQLQPGAKATLELVPTQASNGSRVVITEVQRTAS